MTRRSLSACLSVAALVGALDLPARVTAKPPDLPEDGTFTATPAMSPPAALFRLRPTARRTLAGSLLFGIHPALALLPTDKALDVPSDHPQPRTDDDVLSDVPRDRAPEERLFVISCPMGLVSRENWWKWLISHWTARQQTPTLEENEGYIHDGALGIAIDVSAEEIDLPHDHPQCVAGDDVFGDMPTYEVADWFSHGPELVTHQQLDWLKWRAMQQSVPAPEQNEGYIHGVALGDAIAYLTPEDTPAQETDAPLTPDIETLPMPKEDAATDGITCPYLRQQMKDRHDCQFADPQIGRDVLDNLERLKQADDLIEMAKQFVRDGCIAEAVECCVLAEDLCPGSPSADRAAAIAFDLCFGFDKPAAVAEEAEKNADGSKKEPGVEQQVRGLMKACRLLMNEGLHERAAELARQAYALDPERVMADPLIYKMHLLADTPAKQPFGSSRPEEASEDCEPPTCPYCPSAGKPIRGIVPEKKESKSGPTTLLVPPLPPVDYEVVPVLDRVLTESTKKTEPADEEEASEEEAPSSLQELIETIMDGAGIEADGGLRLSGEWSCGGNVYHLRYNRGCLAIWKTPDASKVKP